MRGKKGPGPGSWPWAGPYFFFLLTALNWESRVNRQSGKGLGIILGWCFHSGNFNGLGSQTGPKRGGPLWGFRTITFGGGFFPLPCWLREDTPFCEEEKVAPPQGGEPVFWGWASHFWRRQNSGGHKTRLSYPGLLGHTVPWGRKKKRRRVLEQPPPLWCGGENTPTPLLGTRNYTPEE